MKIIGHRPMGSSESWRAQQTGDHPSQIYSDAHSGERRGFKKATGSERPLLCLAWWSEHLWRLTVVRRRKREDKVLKRDRRKKGDCVCFIEREGQ